MRRHLYLQIYAAFVLVAVVSVAAAGLVAQGVFDGRRIPEPLVPMAELVAAQIDPADPAASTTALGERLHLRLTLRDAGLRPLGWSGSLLERPDPDGAPAQWLGWSGRPAAAVHLADGRWLAVSYDWRWDHRHFVVGLAVLVLATSVLTLPVLLLAPLGWAWLLPRQGAAGYALLQLLVALLTLMALSLQDRRGLLRARALLLPWLALLLALPLLPAEPGPVAAVLLPLASGGLAALALVQGRRR